jgi:hypothetical protein
MRKGVKSQMILVLVKGADEFVKETNNAIGSISKTFEKAAEAYNKNLEKV